MEDGHSLDSIERYAYCLCLHVRPATIFVSLVNLGGALICAIVTLAVMSYGDSQWQHMTESQKSAATTLAIVIYMMLATVSAMLLYGVIKSRPSYILPFFGIQFIDFLFTLPQFLASLYYHSNHANHWERTHSSAGLFDMKHVWPNSNHASANTSSLMLTTLIVLFKCYFLCVVWKCYRYLRMKEMILPLHLPYHASNVNDLLGASILVPPPNLAPPCYEEATKNCAPPDYESAIKNDEFKLVPATPPQRLQSHEGTAERSCESHSQERVPEARESQSSNVGASAC